MIVYMVRVSASPDQVAEALSEKEPSWALPGLELGECERVGARELRIQAGGSVAAIALSVEDGRECTRLVVRHEPEASPLEGVSPQGGWREAWPDFTGAAQISCGERAAGRDYTRMTTRPTRPWR